MPESDNHNPFAAPQVQDPVARTDGVVDFGELKTVGAGLGLIYISLVLVVILTMATFASAFLAVPGGARIGLVPLLFFVLLLGVGLLLLVGICMCATVPVESGARGLCIAAIAFHVLQIPLSFIGLFGIGTVGVLMMNIMNWLGMICFILFLRKLAMFIYREDLARRAVRLLVIFLTAFVAGVLLLIMLLRSGGGVSGILFGGVALLASLIVFVMFANLVNELGKTIRNPNRTPAASHPG